jgi:hypothetical protein
VTNLNVAPDGASIYASGESSVILKYDIKSGQLAKLFNINY